MPPGGKLPTAKVAIAARNVWPGDFYVCRSKGCPHPAKYWEPNWAWCVRLASSSACHRPFPPPLPHPLEYEHIYFIYTSRCDPCLLRRVGLEAWPEGMAWPSLGEYEDTRTGRKVEWVGGTCILIKIAIVF